MKDVNNVRLSGSIFWSKLDDRQTYSTLRLGIKLANGSSVFASINNPSTKAYDLIKAGNKVLISNGWLDTWEKKEGGSEIQIKANDSGCRFFPKEKALADVNHVVVIGKVLEYSGDTAKIEMYGDRNPKTDQPTIRNAKIKIGDTFGADLVNNKLMLDAKVVSVDESGKSKLVIEADYDKVSVL
jgi:hypothetical protein